MLYVHGTFNKSFEEWREIFFAIVQLLNIQYLYFDKIKFISNRILLVLRITYVRII